MYEFPVGDILTGFLLIIVVRFFFGFSLFLVSQVVLKLKAGNSSGAITRAEKTYVWARNVTLSSVPIGVFTLYLIFMWLVFEDIVLIQVLQPNLTIKVAWIIITALLIAGLFGLHAYLDVTNKKIPELLSNYYYLILLGAVFVLLLSSYDLFIVLVLSTILALFSSAWRWFTGQIKQPEQKQPKKIKTKKYSNVVPVGRFIFLSIFSFGLYQLYWFYKNWKFFKEKESSDISPFWRTVFAPFFVYSLFGKILGYAKREGYTRSYSSVLIALFWIILYRPFRPQDLFWLVFNLRFLPLLGPLGAMNFYWNKKERGYPQKPFNWWQSLLLIFGATGWVLTLIGLLHLNSIL